VSPCPERPPAILETCPHYLVLDDSLYDLPGDESLKYVMSPPLRKPADSEALWAGLQDGRISIVATDHCTWDFSCKKRLGATNFTRCPNGVAGVELRLALIYSGGVVKRRMNLSRFVSLCCTTPARRFGLYPRKGSLSPGADADIVLFDPSYKFRVRHALLHENVDYSPYEGLELQGYPVATFSRGELVMKNGKFIGREGHGRYLKRSLPDTAYRP
jgi:dihydropyrimidinase